MNELMFVTNKGSKFNMKQCGDCKSSIEACYKCVDKNTRLLDAYETAGEAIKTILDSIRFSFTEEDRKEYETLITAKKQIRQKIASMKVCIDPRVWNGGNQSRQQGNEN